MLACASFLSCSTGFANTQTSISAVDQSLVPHLKQAVQASQTDFLDMFEAEVWLLDMASRLDAFQHLSASQRLTLARRIRAEALRVRLSPELIFALIEVESAFQTEAISSAGAQGLMQVMPFWKQEIGRPQDNLFDLDTNLRYGCTILAYYLRLEEGDLTRALARYNGSRGKTWYPERVMRAFARRWRPG
ncbi:lytic transglycosylase domain-containing protein [Allopseudospirillum japonicum]|uniref:lytic transglycosylase domain-containing protein n=1 Tax=Allopseudospirillum japonicum TaxID=64971 RepID=UPI001FDF71EC|nr:lytic transglycosylase domain-containing protein [Allopseudospirillum japonicum]